jgi:spore germination protein KB
MSLEKGMVSNRQAILITTNVIIATTLLFIPAYLARLAGQDAWLTVLITAVTGLIFGLLLMGLGLRFPDKNLVEYSIDILGPWLGRALGVIFGLFALYVAGIVVREFSELLVTAVMPRTPMIVFNTLLVSLAAYGVYLGLETMARVNEIVFPISILVLFVIFALALPEMDWYQLQPVLTHSFSDLFKASAILLSFYTEAAVLLMFIPNLREKEGAIRKILPWVVILVAIILLVVVGGGIALMGAEETGRLIFPTFELAKTIHLGGFIERIESLVVGIWVSMVGLKLMMLYYAGVLALAQALDLRDYHPVVLPGGVILTTLSFMGFTDIVQARSFVFKYWPPLSITFFGGVTLMLWLVALLRKKGGQEKGAGGGSRRGEQAVDDGS